MAEVRFFAAAAEAAGRDSAETTLRMHRAVTHAGPPWPVDGLTLLTS